MQDGARNARSFAITLSGDALDPMQIAKVATSADLPSPDGQAISTECPRTRACATQRATVIARAT